MIAQQIDHSSKGLFQLNEQAGTAKAMFAIETHYLPDEVKRLASANASPAESGWARPSPGRLRPVRFGPAYSFALAGRAPGRAQSGLARPGGRPA